MRHTDHQDKKRKIVSYIRRPIASVPARAPKDAKQDIAPQAAHLEEQLPNVSREVKQTQRKVTITPTKNTKQHQRHRQPDASMPTFPVPERNVFKKLVRTYGAKQLIIVAIVLVCCAAGIIAFYLLRQNTHTPQEVIGEPSVSQIAKYTVAADMPRYLKINAIGVMSRVYPRIDIKEGIKDFVRNSYDVSWYQRSAIPGQPGVSLFGAMKDSSKGSDFGGITSMHPNETIEISMGNGTRYSYKVLNISGISSLASTDINKLLIPNSGRQQELKLIVINDTTQDNNEAFLVQAIRAD